MRLGTQGEDAPGVLEISVVQEKCSALEIRDADSGVLFDSEKGPLSRAQYDALKALVLKSAVDFLANRVFSGSYGEDWSLAKALRRFLWHDRIHAKAMYRMGCAVFGRRASPDVFRFEG